MKKILLAACALLSISVLSVPAHAGDQDFTLRNQTGYDITSVYLSRPANNSWGQDVLGSETLDDGESGRIHFSPSVHSCMWEMRVTFSTGEHFDWNAFNLCETNVVTLRHRHNSITAVAE